MAITSRAQFKQYCLTKLGSPVIRINVADKQIEDRIDDAIELFTEYHYDAQLKTYYKYTLTDTDITNRYVTLPENITGAVKVFNPNGLTPSSYLFDLRYQIALNDMYNLTSHTLVPYVISMQHLALLNEILNGEKPVRYEKLSNKLYVDTDWSKLAPGNNLLVECYKVIDPNEYIKMWDERWLKLYATALIKEQWGENLSKFPDMPLPGGQRFNGAGILQSALEEKQRLRDELDNNYSSWNQMFIG